MTDTTRAGQERLKTESRLNKGDSGIKVEKSQDGFLVEQEMQESKHTHLQQVEAMDMDKFLFNKASVRAGSNILQVQMEESDLLNYVEEEGKSKEASTIDNKLSNDTSIRGNLLVEENQDQEIRFGNSRWKSSNPDNNKSVCTYWSELDGLNRLDAGQYPRSDNEPG